MRRRGFTLLVLLVGGVGVGLVGLLAELALRRAHPDGVVVNIPRIDSYRWIDYDAVLGWKNKASFLLDPEHGIELNSQRMRGPVVSPARRAGTLRVLCLGDSRTFGVRRAGTGGPTFDAGYPDPLRALLSRTPEGDSEAASVEVLNAGVIGYTSAQVLRQLNVDVPRWSPDVVIVAVGFNDFLYAWDPSLLIPEPRSRLARWLFYRAVPLRSFQLLLRAAQVTGFASPAPGAVRWVELEEYTHNLRRVAETARAQGVALLLADLPLRPLEDGENAHLPGKAGGARTLVYDEARVSGLTGLHALFDAYREAALAVALEQKIPVAAVGEAFRAHRERGERMFGPYDFIHSNGLGARVAAETIARELAVLGWIPPNTGNAAAGMVGSR